MLAQDHIFKFELPFEEKFITHNVDQKMHALLFNPAHPVARILYFHGNGGALDGWGSVAQQIVDQENCEVMIVDYPGYGKSTGPLPSNSDSLYASARAAFDEFQRISDNSLPMILYGRSLGTAVASKLASELAPQHKVSALILETPYTSIRAMAAKVVPLIPMFLLRYDMDNQANLKNLDIPIIIFHGTADEVVPYEHGQTIAKNFPNVQFITIPRAGHNDIAVHQEYWRDLATFVKSVVQKP